MTTTKAVTKEASSREKPFHIVKRTDMPKWKSWLIRILSVLASLVVCAIIIVAVTGDNPLAIYGTMVKGAVGSARRVWVLLQEVAMLLCVSLAVTPAFKMRFWNIGAEGQVLMGGLGATAVMLLLGHKLPAPVVLPLVIVVSILCGAIWGVIPAVFKAFWNTNETLFTLMMNYIAIQIVSYFTYIWSSNKGNNVINTINTDNHAGWLNLPSSIDKYGYLLNIIIVAVLTVLMYFYLNRSKQGYEISVVGESINTARYAGINVKKVIIRTMLISGALCGVAGMLLVSGTDHTITPNTAAGRGFTAIMVSWLAKFNPLFMVLTSLLLVFMELGAKEISTVFGLNTSFSEIIAGIIIFFIIGSEFFINYSIKRTHAKEVESK
ncbi:ABC transporter permease [Ruminococcus sp.]|uniref:ABC transporter permease n=1 Tax=Ruminococcus sp. TaxID=41978 RepID=UPI002E8103DF|nr:ABC transporter permease [Ruminococcus sp.]MEE3492820.1 ABC transporter permease [Ruminococcus sp.]